MRSEHVLAIIIRDGDADKKLIVNFWTICD